MPRPPAGASQGRATLVVTFTPRRGRRPAWAPSDWAASLTSIDVGGFERERPPRSRRRSIDVAVADDGIVAGDVVVGWPGLSLWRAPTDNDDPPGEWRETTPAAGWRADGLDRIAETAAEVRRRGGAVIRVVSYKTGTGQPIDHRQRIEIDDGTAHITETIRIDRALRDLPRVGVAFALPDDFARLTWLGLGPGDSYPDRRAAAGFGRWEAVGDLAVPFVRPQEYGLHLDTEWFEVASPDVALRIAGDRPLAFSALPHSVEELEAATHAHLLGASTATHIHLDIAHRGLGTAACGPDAHPRHLVRGGTYRFTWTLSAHRPF
jgi:beta-galactosidase